MTQIDLKTSEMPVHKVAVSYSTGEYVMTHAVSLDKSKLPFIEGAKIATDIPLYLGETSLEAVEQDNVYLDVIYKQCENGEVIFQSAHPRIKNDIVPSVLQSGYFYDEVDYISRTKTKQWSPKSNETYWLRNALNNQKDNVIHGSSRKFPCQTEEEKNISLTCIDGMLKLLEECDQYA